MHKNIYKTGKANSDTTERITYSRVLSQSHEIRDIRKRQKNKCRELTLDKFFIFWDQLMNGSNYGPTNSDFIVKNPLSGVFSHFGSETLF